MQDRSRTKKAQTPPAADPDGFEAPRFDDDAAEAVSGRAFRARGRGPGRRKTDRDPAEQTASAIASKPHAPLVAHLIATALNLEQTRVRRRGSEKDAAALYARKQERAKRPRGEA